jgi:hypothetical protein
VKPKLTDETRDRICQLIAAGNPYSVAYGQAGVAKRTFMDWMAKGRAERTRQEAGERARRGEAIYLEFLLAVEQAEHTAKALLVTSWVKAAKDGDWRAARDFLARRWPDEWMPRESRQLTGADGGPIAVETTGNVHVDGEVTIRDDSHRIAEVMATLIEANLLPAEAAAALRWVPDPDEEGAGPPPAEPGAGD